MPDWFLQLIGYAAVGGGAYAAIRADLAAVRVKAEQALLSSGDAHRRIDKVMEGRPWKS